MNLSTTLYFDHSQRLRFGAASIHKCLSGNANPSPALLRFRCAATMSAEIACVNIDLNAFMPDVSIGVALLIAAAHGPCDELKSLDCFSVSTHCIPGRPLRS